MEKEKDNFLFEKEKDGSFLYTKRQVGDNSNVAPLPQEKLHQSRVDEALTERSAQRQSECWCFGCDKNASVWVREVQFDMLGDKQGPNQHVVSSRDYEGPAPGFCSMHIGSGPTQLAETVYWDKTEIYLGLRPRKWWVIFTDGTKQGGLCEVINPKGLAPSTYDLHIKSPTT